MRSSTLTRVLTAAAISSNTDGFMSNAPMVPTHHGHTALHAAFSQESESHIVGRRKAFHSMLGGAAVFAFAAMPKVASALDMDAFANSELDSDTKNCNAKLDPKCVPKLTQDEALCKYGQSGEARGEACKRVKQKGGELPGAKKEKSLGGAYAM